VPLGRVFGNEIGRILARAHQDHGVVTLFEDTVGSSVPGA
jgi:hypothetical protein